MDQKKFKEELLKHNVDLTDQQLKQFQQYAEFIVDYNKKVNLTSITNIEDIYSKHFYDCILPFVKLNFDDSMSLADVGSGAGFPGLVLKIAFPVLNITLIEPTLKRCNFLNETIKLLNLENINVINKRAEDLSELRSSYDYVTARAVAPLNVLSELCAPLLKTKGLFIIMRGKDGLNELKKARSAFDKLNLNEIKTEVIEYDDNTRTNSIYQLVKPIHKKYPRNYSIIKQKPL